LVEIRQKLIQIGALAATCWANLLFEKS